MISIANKKMLNPKNIVDCMIVNKKFDIIIFFCKSISNVKLSPKPKETHCEHCFMIFLDTT